MHIRDSFGIELPHLVSPFSLARPHLVYVLKKSRPLAFRPRSRVQLTIWLAIDRIIKSRNQCCKINTTIREMGKSQKREKKKEKERRRLPVHFDIEDGPKIYNRLFI